MIKPSELTDKIIRYGEATYQFIEKIGEGGFAYVYKAIRRDILTHQVAIKVLKDKYAYEQKWREYFRQEALAHQRVSDSPQVVSLHTFIDGNKASSEGIHMMVMEWVDGVPIDKWITSPTVQLKNKLEAIRQICHGLNTIHGRNKSETLKGYMAHGDITPRNIMITTDNDVRIIDFGLAWDIREDNIEIAKKNAGTISYIAPEQLETPDDTNPNADIFSLGAVLYLIFTGEHYNPNLVEAEKKWKTSSGLTHSHEDLKQFLKLMKSHTPQPIKINELPESINQQINELVLGMLNPDPEQRQIRIRSANSVKNSVEKIYISYITSQNKSKPNTHESSHEKKSDDSRYYILVARRREDLILDEPLALLYREQEGRKYFISSLLYSAHSDQQVYTILYNKNMEIVERLIFQPLAQEFYFYLDITDGPSSDLQINHGEKVDKFNDESFLTEEIKVLKDRPIDLLLLLDRSMTTDQLTSHAIPLIEKIVKYLDNSGRLYELTTMLYGEYKYHPYGESWDINFDIAYQKTQVLSDVKQFLKFQFNKRVKLDKKSYCGALELGLLRAVDGTIKWRNDTPGYIIMIGASPPHPTATQQIKYGLGSSDYSIEEFSASEDWMYLIDYLSKNDVKFAHLWLPFTNIENVAVPPPPEVQNYINMFSEYVNSDNQFHEIDDVDFLLPREVERIASEIVNYKPYRLSRDCYLPLAQALKL